MQLFSATDIQVLPVVGLFTVAITSGLHDHLQPHSYPHTTIPPTQLPSHDHTPHTATLTRPSPHQGVAGMTPCIRLCGPLHRCAGTITGVLVLSQVCRCTYHHRCAGTITGVLVPSQVCWCHHRCAGTITGVLVPSQVCWYRHRCAGTITVC